MRSFALVMVAAAILAAPLLVEEAHAQLEFSLGGGVNSPSGDYGDLAKPGYSITTGLGYRFLPMISAGLEASFMGNNATDEILDGLGEGWEMRSTIFNYGGVAKLLVPFSRHFLYAKGTVGNYRGGAQITGPLGDFKVVNTESGYGLGGGLMISGKKNSSFFLDFTYHKITFPGDDIDTKFLAVNAGAIFTFDLSPKPY